MQYVKGEGNEALLTLTAVEHDKLKGGETIRHRVGSAYGVFDIEIKMSMVEFPEEYTGPTIQAARFKGGSMTSETVPSDGILRNRARRTVKFLKSGEVTWASPDGGQERVDHIVEESVYFLHVAKPSDGNGHLLLTNIEGWSILIDPNNIEIMGEVE